MSDRSSASGGQSASRAPLARAAFVLALAGLPAPVLAQTASAPAQPTITAGPTATTSLGPQAATTIKKLVADGYEIKTGFIDPNGGAYLALQKTTSAYLCHSNPNPTCEKLN